MPRLCTVLLLVAAMGLAACQPIDRDTGAVDDRDTPAEPAPAPLGAPVRGMPSDLEQLLERTDQVAREWQDEPHLAEVLVEIGPDGRWRRAQATYLAAEADRLLLVTVDGDGLRQERPTLATLALQPVNEAGMRRLPLWPDGVPEPAGLVEALRADLRRCEVGAVEGVLYATGAPVAWDGRRWTAPPEWTATVTAERGAVQADPVSGEDARCVDGDD